MSQSVLYSQRKRNQLPPQSKQNATEAREKSPLGRNIEQIQTPKGCHLPVSWGHLINQIKFYLNPIHSHKKCILQQIKKT